MRISVTMIGLVLAGWASTTLAASYQPDDITGVWRTKSGGYVQVYKSDHGYDGKIVGSTDGKARYDKQNPDKSKRDRRLLGVVILNGLQSEGDGEYGDGKIYDPNNGKTYSANAKLTGHDTLDARGYIGFSLLGKTQTWHRIDPQSKNVQADELEQPVGAPPQH